MLQDKEMLLVISQNFLNGKKIPCITAIIHNNDFREKGDLFNTFFTQQCFLIENSITLPTCIFPRTGGSLSLIFFFEEDILNIIRSLDPNKVHGNDNITFWMIKLYSKEICKPLHMLFVSCMKEGFFPFLWKMANAVPAHKENDKRSIKSYCPVSLLPIFGKIFDCILYNQMYSFFIENNLISLFRQGDSCVTQFIFITQEIDQWIKAMKCVVCCWICLKYLIKYGTTQQTLKIDSTLIYVEITSQHQST